MPRHIESHDNRNEPIVAEDDPTVPLVYFNRLWLDPGQSHEFRLAGHEACVVPVTGTCGVDVAGRRFEDIGGRTRLWDGVPNAVYVPVNAPCTVTAGDARMEVFVAGGRFDETLEPFAVRDDDVQIVQYGSDETKTHRKIKHLLGQGNAPRRGRLLVSELFTVGAGGWSGFPPHKHDTERPPEETRFEEVYNFRFDPEHGFGCQFDYLSDGGGADGRGPDGASGRPHHIRNDSTYLIDRGYHPCVAAPGYEMYYFTIIVGERSQSLRQHFEPAHAHQIETIPGIKDMVAAFE